MQASGVVRKSEKIESVYNVTWLADLVASYLDREKIGNTMSNRMYICNIYF